MKKKSSLLVVILNVLTLFGGLVVAQEYKYLKTVIAHRGASGYLPEHSLAGVALAHGMNPDYIEPDVVLTRDNKAIVLHDIHLETTTNVGKVFPNRKRSDGRYYAIDFDLAEIKSLELHERSKGNNDVAVFPDRFPVGKSSFQVPTLEEEIELVLGMNKSRGVNIGVYPEIKDPAFHKKEGKDITKIVLAILDKYKASNPELKIYLQCFDLDELERIKGERGDGLELIYLLNAKGVDQLVRANDSYLKALSQTVDGLGVSINGLLRNAKKAKTTITKLHELGLVVHAWTVRKDSLPSTYNSVEKLLQDLDELAVDGVFTDFSDIVVALIR